MLNAKRKTKSVASVAVGAMFSIVSTPVPVYRYTSPPLRQHYTAALVRSVHFSSRYGVDLITHSTLVWSIVLSSTPYPVALAPLPSLYMRRWEARNFSIKRQNI